MDFADQVVLVTGSSSGIGEATARHFDALGATVVVNSARSVDAGQAVADSLARGSYVQGDVATDGAGIIDQVLERHGRLDVLVNNAGTTAVIDHADLAAADVEVFRRIFEVNVFGTWAVTVAAVDALRRSGGAVVNVTSIAGIRPSGSSIPYAASKAALNHLTVLLAKVLGPEVRVNAVAPGLIDTPWTADWASLKPLVAGMTPLKRTGQPDDIAQAICAVAANTFMTGQVVVVDGGLTIAS